jgi:hypothetical protein
MYDRTVEKFDYKGYTVRIEWDDNPESPREWGNLGTMVCWSRRYNFGDEQPKCDPEEWLADLACQVDGTVEGRLLYWENEGWNRFFYSDESVAQPSMGKSVQYADLGKSVQYADKKVRERKRAIIQKALDKRVIMLPLYVYEHGGVAMSTGAYSDPWDSGQVGWVYVTKEDVREEYGKQRISAKLREAVEGVLKSEVETYAQYLEGAVYGYVVEDEEGEHIDSCWGFYGDTKYAEGEAKSAIDWIVEKHEREEREAFQRRLSEHVEQVKAWIKNGVPLVYREGFAG